MANCSCPSTLTGSVTTSATRAAAGPSRRKETSSATAGSVPSAWTSTSPASPLRTHPIASSSRARATVALRKPTPWTSPRTTARTAVAADFAFPLTVSPSLRLAAARQVLVEPAALFGVLVDLVLAQFAPGDPAPDHVAVVVDPPVPGNIEVD